MPPYPKICAILLPLERYEPVALGFGERVSLNGTDWGEHLGEDINCTSGTEVRAVSNGRVVYAALHKGSKEKPNWGNVVIVGHKKSGGGKFFSVYGHLADVCVSKGARVSCGEKIGVVAPPNTPENGFWSDAHLHFGIYTGLFSGSVLPGYFRSDQNRTDHKSWKSPKEFLEELGKKIEKNGKNFS